MPTTYQFNNIDFRISITAHDAYFRLPDKGIDVLNLIDDDNLKQLVTTIHFDDRTMLDLWWETVSPELGGDFESALRLMDIKVDLKRFKDAFWQEVLNFTPRLSGVLTDVKHQIMEEIKRLNEGISKSSSGTSKVEQE